MAGLRVRLLAGRLFRVDYWGGLREVLCLQLCGDDLNVTGEPNWTHELGSCSLPLSRRKEPALDPRPGAPVPRPRRTGRSQRRRSGRRKGAKRIRHSGCRSRLPLRRREREYRVDPDSIPAVREARHALLGAPGMDPDATDGRSDDAVFVGTSGRSSRTPRPPCAVIAAPLPRPSDAFRREQGVLVLVPRGQPRGSRHGPPPRLAADRRPASAPLRPDRPARARPSSGRTVFEATRVASPCRARIGSPTAASAGMARCAAAASQAAKSAHGTGQQGRGAT